MARISSSSVSASVSGNETNESAGEDREELLDREERDGEVGQVYEPEPGRMNRSSSAFSGRCLSDKIATSRVYVLVRVRLLHMTSLRTHLESPFYQALRPRS